MEPVALCILACIVWTVARAQWQKRRDRAPDRPRPGLAPRSKEFTVNAFRRGPYDNLEVSY